MGVLALLSTSVAFADEAEDVTDEIVDETTDEEVDETSIIEPIYDVVDEFSDVDEDHDFIVAIEYVFDAGLVNGNPDGTFTPDETLNRAEMLKILVLAAGADEDEIAEYEDEECFWDVPVGEWFTGYVCYGEEMGYIRGFGDGSFRPASPVTFAQGMKIAYESFELEWTENEPPEFWYKDLIVAATGSDHAPATITDFNQALLRSEMADMTARIHSDLDSETGLEDYLESLGEMGDVKVTFDTIKNGEDVLAEADDDDDEDEDDTEDDDTEDEEELGEDDTAPEIDTSDTDTDADLSDDDEEEVDNLITITADGFSEDISILVGQTVTWTNEDTEEHWPASNDHPDHTGYTGTDNADCGEEDLVMFDSCAGLAEGESWTFTFDEEGTWGYHDHLNSSLTGEITVSGIELVDDTPIVEI